MVLTGRIVELEEPILVVTKERHYEKLMLKFIGNNKHTCFVEVRKKELVNLFKNFPKICSINCTVHLKLLCRTNNNKNYNNVILEKIEIK